MIKMNRILLLICILLMGFCCYAQEAASTADVKKPTYEDLLSNVKSGGASIDDFKALRFAFAETKNYSPYGNRTEGAIKMSQALREQRYKDAAKEAQARLKTAFADIDAQMVAAIAYRNLNDAAKAKFHGDIYLGLLYSIMKGSNGKTPEKAYVVISTDEEYQVMQAMGYSVSKQTLIQREGHSYDVLSGLEKKTNQPVEIYFNIDIVWKAETNMFKQIGQ